MPWLLRLLTRLWLKWNGFKQEVKPLFEEAMEHSREVHGDTCVHNECRKCMRLAKAMIQVYGMTPAELANNPNAGVAAKVARAMLATKESKWTTH